MSVVEGLYGYLEDAGLAGGATGWGLIRRRVMDAPALDRLVVLTEDGGVTPEFPAATGIGDTALKDPAVQVRVRAEEWNGDVAFAKAQQIMDALHGQRDLTLDSVEYERISAQTPEPVFIGFDSVGRPEFTQSFRMLTTALI